MKMYYNITDPADIRDLESIMDAWIQANNPKANDWRILPPRPSEYATWGNGEWIVPSQEYIDSIISAQDRATQRTALKQQWDALPAYIRGPYRDKFEAANRLLDEGDDESAIALIEYTEPMPGFTDDQINIFNIAKQQRQQGIANLPNIS